MGFKFVEKAPGAARGVSAQAPFSDNEIAELEAHPGLWALVAEDTDKPQRYQNWVRRTNGTDDDDKPNNGPWRVRTTIHINEDGEKHVVKGKTQSGTDKETRFVDVYVSYDPEGKAK